MKQIEEMAKVIKSSMDNLGCGNFNFTGDEISTMFAKALYNAGYRKESEVAREIFGEIEKILLDNHIGHYKTTKDTWTYNFNNEILTEIAELKKKYTEGKDV